MRIVVGILLFLGGLIGLGMTACGGIVTVMMFDTKNSGGYQGWMLSVPSLLAGLLLLRLVARQFAKWRRSDAATPLPPA